MDSCATNWSFIDNFKTTEHVHCRLAAGINYYGWINYFKLNFLTRSSSYKASGTFHEIFGPRGMIRLNHEFWPKLYIGMYICMYNYEHAFIMAKYEL